MSVVCNGKGFHHCICKQCCKAWDEHVRECRARGYYRLFRFRREPETKSRSERVIIRDTWNRKTVTVPYRSNECSAEEAATEHLRRSGIAVEIKASDNGKSINLLLSSNYKARLLRYIEVLRAELANAKK